MTGERFDPHTVAEYESVTWSRCAENYMDGFSALTREAIDPLLAEVKLSRGDRVLDVGTGPGLVAAAATERGADVVGIDFSETMVTKARQCHPGIEFHMASADALPFEDGSFDVVIGNFVLHHVGQPDAVLREAWRVLRRGGRVGFTVWADPSTLEAFGLFFAALEEHAGSAELPHGPLFGVSDFAVFHDMARRAGFRDSSVSHVPIAWRTASLGPYLAAFRDWANLDTLPDEVRDRIENAMRKSAESYWSGHAFAIPNPAILVAGVK